MATPTADAIGPDLIRHIPDPQAIRLQIADHLGRVLVLKRLLKAAEAKFRQCPDRREVARVAG